MFLRQARSKSLFDCDIKNNQEFFERDTKGIFLRSESQKCSDPFLPMNILFDSKLEYDFIRAALQQESNP